MEKYIGVKPSDKRPSPKKDRQSIMATFEEQMLSKPSFMFSSNTKQRLSAEESTPGPQDYSASAAHMLKKDFSRPRFVNSKPTRNLDGAIRTQPYISSNELKHKNLSPGPVAPLESPAKAKERHRTEPRMRQYGLNMISNTLPDPEQVKSSNEVAKAQIKKRLTADSVPGPGQYNPIAKTLIGGSNQELTP